MRIGIDEPARLGRTELRGGRVLGWAEWGPADGTAVLLCPGAAQSRTLGFGTDLVDELGVRLISVDRPGLGVSDPAPGRTLLDFAEDVRDFAERRELPAMAVVGYSTGGPFALACAARGVAVAAAVVAGGDELPRFTGRLDPQVAETVGSVLADPRRAEETFAGFGDVDAMWDMIIAGSSEMDRAVYCRPEFEAALRRAMAGDSPRGPRATPVTRCWFWGAGRSPSRRSPCRCTSATASTTRARCTHPTSVRAWPDASPAPPDTSCRTPEARCCGPTPRPSCENSWRRRRADSTAWAVSALG